jgi:hypothetical protein
MISAFGVEHSISKKLSEPVKAGLIATGAAATGAGIGFGAVAMDNKKKHGNWRGAKPEKAFKMKTTKDWSDMYRANEAHKRQKKLAKSFVPGKGYSVASGAKGWKKAKDLTHEERAAVKANPTPKKIGERGGRFQMAARRDAAGKTRREIWPGVQTPHGKLTKVTPAMREGEHPALQGYSQPNGKGGGHVRIFHDTQDVSHTLRHEKAHITPKRNPVRFQERYANEARRGREEGRADFTASGKQTTGRYPGGEDFQRGYNEVQGKMASNKFRKKLRRQ